MSNLDTELEDEEQDILALNEGDDWAAQYEAAIAEIQRVFGLAERDDHDHTGETINPAATNTGELSVGGFHPHVFIGNPLASSGDSIVTDDDTTTNDARHVGLKPSRDDGDVWRMRFFAYTISATDYGFLEAVATKTGGIASPTIDVLYQHTSGVGIGPYRVDYAFNQIRVWTNGSEVDSGPATVAVWYQHIGDGAVTLV